MGTRFALGTQRAGALWEFLPHYVRDGGYGFGGFFPWA